jgi:hypothetical protein
MALRRAVSFAMNIADFKIIGLPWVSMAFINVLEFIIYLTQNHF